MTLKKEISSLSFDGKSKSEVLRLVEEFIIKQGFTVHARDLGRPWGGFFVIDETQARPFASLFFPSVKFEDLGRGGKLSPKFLVVQPATRLSWQYHHRRAEIWRVVAGKVGVTLSDTDEEKKKVELSPGETINLQQGERHRLRGLATWGVIAEIWQHTDSMNPSDENDIVRVQDDFGR